MIKLTRLNGSQFVLNADMIETVEATPDTVVSLTNEHKYVVREDVETIVALAVSYKRAIFVEGPRVL